MNATGGTDEPHHGDASANGDQGGEPHPQPFGERREVTALCYDLVGSTELLAHSDLEDFQDVISAFQGRVAEAVRAQGGLVRETLGDDGGMAFFGYPVPAEDSATAAINAGLNIVEACRSLSSELATELHVRIGIATSDVIVQAGKGSAGAVVVGLAPNLAARTQTVAPQDAVVVAEQTHRAARRFFSFQHLGTQRLKGLDDDYALWRVTGRSHSASRFFATGKLGTRMVGREAELETALGRWERAAAGEGQTLVVEGEAGIGKSRFVHELLRRTRGRRGRVLVFQCSPRKTDVALGPLIDVVRSASGAGEGGLALTIEQIAELMRREGIDDEFAIEMIAYAVGAVVPFGQIAAEVGPQRIRERLIGAMRRCIEQWSGARPIILAVEDLHWVDQTSKALIFDLVDWIRTKPVMLLLTSRDPVEWGEQAAHVARIPLDRLQASEADELVSILWQRHKGQSLPPEAASLIYQRTNGVPLFLEEISQWLGTSLSSGRNDWIERLSSARISSFETLLSARLGELGPAKSVAQAASAVGREFGEEFLHALVPEISRAHLSSALSRLVQANILVPKMQGHQPGYSFRHSLIQETLYGTLLRKSRASLHRQIYSVVTSRPKERLWMGASVLAEHAERAGLLKEAAGNYIEAAKESSARSAIPEARHLLQQALRVLRQATPDDDCERLELAALAALGPVLTSTEGTKSEEACLLYERAVQIARRRPAAEQARLFPIYWGWWYTGSDFAIQRERAEAVMADLKDVADPEVRLQMHHCVWAIDFNMGRHDTCIAAVDAGMALYQAGKGRESVTLYGGHDPRVCGLGQKGLSLWFKGFPGNARTSVEESVRWANEIAHVGSVAHALDIAAMLHRYRRDYRSLQDTSAEMLRLARKHELRSLAAKALIFEGWRIANLGDPGRGRHSAEEGLAIQREIGTREDFPVYSEMLAEILELLSETQLAARLLDEAVQEAERTGHRYWLPELCRRRAAVGAKLGAGPDDTAALLARGLQVAREQNAMTLLLSICETAMHLGVFDRMGPDAESAVRLGMASVERGGELSERLASISRQLDDRAGSR